MARSSHRRLGRTAARDGWAVGITFAFVAAMFLAGSGETDFLASSSAHSFSSFARKPTAVTQVKMQSLVAAPMAWPACMLIAAAASAAFSRNAGRKPLRHAVLQPRGVALRSLPVRDLTASSIRSCCIDTQHQSDLLSLDGCEQSRDSDVFQHASLVEPLCAVLQQEGTSGARQPDALHTGRAHSSKHQQHQRKDGGRRERRHVGAKLLTKSYAEIPCSSFEPSRVPLKMQRSLQAHSFPKTGGREAKTKADSGSASSADMGLHSFNITSMVASYFLHQDRDELLL